MGAQEVERDADLGRIVGVEHHGVHEGHRVVLAGRTDEGHAARGHDLQTHQAERLMP